MSNIPTRVWNARKGSPIMFEDVIVKDWQPIRPWMPHRTIRGKLVLPGQKVYYRVVRKYRNAQFEPVIEYGDIFDILKG